MYKDRGAEIINEQREESQTVSLWWLRNKAFLHIVDPVLCAARKMAASTLSFHSDQDKAERNDWLQRGTMGNKVHLKAICGRKGVL